MTIAPAPLEQRRAAHRRQIVVVLAALAALLGTGVVLHDDLVGGSSGSGTVQGSGVAVTQSRQVAAFDRFELAGDAGVTIHVGEDRSVVVSADDNLLGRVTTAVRHGTLVVGTIGNYTAKTPMTVAVGVPTLDALVLSGDGLVNADGIDTARLAVLLSGDGALGAAGGAGRLDVRLSGAGAAQLQQLVARDVRATLSGDGQILVTATRSLHASVSGTGTIVYAGNPAHVTRSITGTGTIAMK